MKVQFKVLFLIVLLLSITSVFAITGSIGNSRVVLRLDPGETVEKSILVKNVNDIPVNVNITVGGDLANRVDIKDSYFVLQPGDEKKAYYDIKAQKERNTTETKFAVTFTSDEGNVGLLATVIVITEDSSDEEDSDSDSGFSLGGLFGGDEDVDSDTDNSDNSITGNSIFDTTKINPIMALSISTLVLLLVFIVLIVYASKKKNKLKKTVKQVE